MIEVKIQLEHEGEIHLLQQFVGFLRTARADWATRGGFDSPLPPGGELVTTEQPEAPAVNGVVEPRADGITLTDLEKAIMDFAKAKGTPAAVALLAEFNAKRLPDLESKDYARFFSKCYPA